MPRLTTIPFSTFFDLEPWVGQRSISYRFKLVDSVTGQNLGDITPIRNGSLSHNTENTIKRQLTLNLGAADVAAINTVRERIVLSMEANSTSYPLGEYIFTDDTRVKYTSGKLGNVVLSDDMFRVDQPLVAGIDGVGQSVIEVYTKVLEGFNIALVGEASPFLLSQAWGVGQSAGGILASAALAGDYFNPWFGNDGKLHLIRSFNPATQVPQFDYDRGNQVIRTGISESSNLLTAPNRFMVTSNTNIDNGGIVAIATVPPGAPNSFANRGFYITSQKTLQLTDLAQATSVANNLANRQTIFETVRLTTAPDPRHDSYDVIFWDGDLWLELSWSLDLTPGGAMTHILRKGYKP